MSSFISRVCLGAVLVVTGCGGSHSTPPGGQTSSAVIGASGATVTSSDGALAVEIPPGALAADVTVTIAPAASQGGAVGTVYEIGPTGTQFSAPVTLTLHYASASLGGADPSLLRVATFAAGSWQILPGAAIDTTAQTVSGTTTHLSMYALVLEPDGSICATVNTGAHCADGTGACGITCATATGVCANYPGATMTTCTDGTDGVTATCCFAPGASVCLATQSAGCHAGLGATCPPTPTCATATDACAAFPGAALQDCVDSTSGYTGSCCFAPSAPVCVGVSGSPNCGHAADGGASCPVPTCAGSSPCAGLPGATVESCTDSATGYTAACCYPAGELPPPGGTTTSSGTTSGPSDGGAPSGNDAGHGATSGGH